MARAVLKGLPVSPGIAIAELAMTRDTGLVEKRNISESETELEIAALERASGDVCRRLQKTMLDLPESLSECREIISAQSELARDSRLLNGAKARIKARRICAAWAVSETAEELCSLFQGFSNPYISDRAQDIRMICKSITDSLGGAERAVKEKAKKILAAYELSPAEILEPGLDEVLGLITVEGGATSHSAILARGLKAPAVIGVADLLKEAVPGETVIVDGLAGLIILDPSAEDLKYYKAKKENYLSYESAANSAASLPAVTRDSYSVGVRANLDNPSELPCLGKSGAEGIGLYRTEWAYLGPELPDEEKLYREYSAVLSCAAPNQVIFRTFDLGSDKLAPRRPGYPEPNPALGVRGIRLSLSQRDIFRTQLRALLRAGHGANMALMLPMISSMSEVEETMSLIESVKAELAGEGLPHSKSAPLGVMVETPAAMMICDALAEACGFLSVGTNDLIHYLMAIDRNNRRVAYLHEPLHPAFTRSLKKIIDSAHMFGKPVSVCGELASDPFMAALLVGMGIDNLSAAPRFVPGLKRLVRQLKASDCAELAKAALNEQNAGKTRSLLYEALRQALGSDLSFHNTFIPDNARHEQKTGSGIHCGQ